jgi:hypothetical protein
MAEEKRVREGNEALAGVERWARENWHGREDNEAVAAKYRGVRDAFKGTPAAETADLRMKEIRAGKRHPHPDKQWSDADVVAQALEAWRTNREEVERLVDETKFAEAQALLPAEVQDSTGAIGKELAFWHKHLAQLLGFQAAVIRETGSIPEAERVIALADGRSLPRPSPCSTAPHAGRSRGPRSRRPRSSRSPSAPSPRRRPASRCSSRPTPTRCASATSSSRRS